MFCLICNEDMGDFDKHLQSDSHIEQMIVTKEYLASNNADNIFNNIESVRLTKETRNIYKIKGQVEFFEMFNKKTPQQYIEENPTFKYYEYVSTDPIVHTDEVAIKGKILGLQKYPPWYYVIETNTGNKRVETKEERQKRLHAIRMSKYRGLNV